jgi:hypothetical protein
MEALSVCVITASRGRFDLAHPGHLEDEKTLDDA